MPPSTVAPDFDRGRRIGKYEILTRLSMGGMAELFLAYFAGPGGFRKYVAVKQILPDIKKDESFVKMFLDEARITAALNHANIGQVYELGEEEGELYLAMEFLPGQNLEQVVKRAAKTQKAIPLGFATRVVRDSVLALHYAANFSDAAGKTSPVVHRDVSPKNVMITYAGDVKVIDFGIAKAKGRLNRTMVGIVKGTSGYMSPEQVKNEPLDGRTDLFAAAVMLYELVTGTRLFSAQNDVQMMMKIVEGEIAPPSSLAPDLSPALEAVVLKGLERPREARWATGKEFARAIEQASPELFDNDQIGAFMAELFDDKIKTTRALLELATTNDTASMTKAVAALSDEAAVSTPPARKAVSAKATPQPRPGISNPRRPVVQKPVTSKRLPAIEEPEDTDPGKDIDATIPPRPKKPTGAIKKVEPPRRNEEDEDTPAPRKRAPAPAAAPAPEPLEAIALPKRSLGGPIAVVLLLVAVGGGGWAVTAGPLKDSALVANVKQRVEKEVRDEEPAPEPPKSLEELAKQNNGPKPQWMVEKEAADKVLAEEKTRQQEIEQSASDPEKQNLLKEIDGQLLTLNRLEAEQRQLLVDAKASKQTGVDNSKRIAELERKINALTANIADKKDRVAKTGGAPKSDAVVVVNDKKSAQAADMGTLVLSTYNPAKAAVYLDTTPLGDTPLKTPMPAGLSVLRVVDGDGKNHQLSVKIERGKTLELKAVDVGSIPLAP
jgi:serine/threonine-protein kinase